MTRGTEEMLNLDDSRAPRRKNSAGDQSMRRSIQDLVSSIDPSVKIEPDVEDVCPHFFAIADLLTRCPPSCCSTSPMNLSTRSRTFLAVWPNTVAVTRLKFEISSSTSNGTTIFVFLVSSLMKPGFRCLKRPLHLHHLPPQERVAPRRAAVKQRIA